MTNGLKVQRPTAQDGLTCDEVAKGFNDAVQAANLINAGFWVLGDPSQGSHSELQVTAWVSELMQNSSSVASKKHQGQSRGAPCDLADWWRMPDAEVTSNLPSLLFWKMNSVQGSSHLGWSHTQAKLISNTI